MKRKQLQKNDEITGKHPNIYTDISGKHQY